MIDAPAMDAPAMDAPAMDAPAMDAPAMDAPAMDAPAMDAPVIDLHVHYYTDQYIDAVKASKHIDTYRRADGRLVARWRSGVALTVVDPHPGPAQRIEMMDELGIEMQVLSVPSPNAYFLEPTEAGRLSRDTNEAFAEIVRAHPTRFSSLAMAPLQDTDRALQVLDHAIDELEMAGIHILSNIDGMPLDDPKLDPFWESANDRGLLVYVHPTVPTPHITTPTPCRSPWGSSTRRRSRWPGSPTPERSSGGRASVGCSRT